MQAYFQYQRLRQQAQGDVDVAARTGRLNLNSLNEKIVSDEDQPSDVLPDDIEKAAPENASSPIPGVELQPPMEASSGTALIVDWRDKDPENPQFWPMHRKWMATITCCAIGIAMTLPTSIEGPSQLAFNEYYGVNPLAGSMTTGIFLIGIGVGSLFAGPFSETFGRNAVYFSALVVAMLFTMAKALAPNYGAAIAFRFLCALFSAAPMTVAGGTIGDIWLPHQIPFGLPFATFTAYTGPILGPVVGAYLPQIGFAWADWISLIAMGLVTVFTLLAQPETYGPTLLEWRARHLRQLTGDNRYQTAGAGVSSLGPRLLTNLYRPFLMIWTEPIILVFSFYLILLYFVLFTFLSGYEVIFTQTYGISLGLTYILWAAMIPGVFVAMAMIPYVYSLTKKAARKSEAVGKPLQPEVALYWAMAGASILMPVSLFWMAWTCYPTISIWSPIVASGVFGYSLVCIFTTSYQYIIFVYLQYAASALGFMTFSRYAISGALTPAAVRMYADIGPHWSLTISAVVATFMAPVPFVLYRYGHKVRAMSKNAQNKS